MLVAHGRPEAYCETRLEWCSYIQVHRAGRKKCCILEVHLCKPERFSSSDVMVPSDQALVMHMENGHMRLVPKGSRGVCGGANAAVCP